MATIVAAAGGGNWTSTSTWVGAVVPTAADDVQLTSTSGNVTINSAAVCRSLDCTGYTGTLTHAAAVTLTIGDATAGAGNTALKLVVGMTYVLGNAASSAISFASTSSTVQTIATGGQTLGNWTINGAGSSYTLADSNTTTTSAAVAVNAGSLNTNNQTCNWGSFNSNTTNVRSITLGTSSISMINAGGTFDVLTTTNLTFSGASSSLTLGGNGYLRSAQTFGTVTFNVTSVAQSQGFSCTTLTINGGAAKCEFYTASNITVSGTLTVAGNSAINRLLIHSSAAGLLRTITAGTVVASNADFQDINGAGAANWDLSGITGGSGDAGGNFNITFTPAAAQTWQGTNGGNWSDVTKWTSRIPLPQDDVTISSAFAASQTITADMPRLGRNIDFTGTTGNPTWTSTGAFGISNFGSLTLVSTMTFNHGSGYTLSGRNGTFTLTTAGRTFTINLIIQANGGSYTLQDAFTSNFNLSIFGGTFNTGGNTVTCASLNAQNAGTVFNMGASTINLTSVTGGTNIFLRTNSAAMTAGAATVNIVNAASGQRNIALSAVDMSAATINYTVSGSTGPLAITGTFPLGTLNFYDAANSRTLYFQSSNTVTITNFNVFGAAGRPVTVASCSVSSVPTTGTAHTISKPYGYVNTDYLILQDSSVTGGASWYAGANSTNVSNNSGWFFQAYSPSRFMTFM